MDEKMTAFKTELEELQTKLQDPGIFSTPEYPRLAKRLANLEKIVGHFNDIKMFEQKIEDSNKTIEEAEKLGLEQELISSYQKDINDYQSAINRSSLALEETLQPKDPNADKDCIFEIRPGAGGDESSLFAGELYRMYARFAETHDLKVELISEVPSEAGGFKEIIFALRGEGAYGRLHLEAGVHRVQRVPATESQGRIHTSTVTVAVLPEAEESDIEINQSELRIDVYRSGGHGGQSVNTTDSAVRITHVPTGIVVTNQDEKSQIKNKLKAMSVLRSRLLQMKIDEQQKQLSDSRKKLIGTGDRSEKIRTYNFPQDRITDHRIGYSRSNIPGAMAGQIDDIIEELHKAEHDLLSNESV